jgi:hypothetical protein
MISYVEEQGSYASVVHDDGTRTQFVLGNYEIIGWDREEICCMSRTGECNFFTATGESRGMYRLGLEKEEPISFTNGILLYEHKGLGIKYAHNRRTGETRNASY